MLPKFYSLALAATGMPLALQVVTSAGTLIKVLLSVPMDSGGLALFLALVHPAQVELL